MENGTRSALSVKGLVKQFGPVRALDGVDLEFSAGEVHGLVGENGAGKSTFMKILAGVETPTAGSIAVGGVPVRIHNVPEAMKLGIVMIHQELNLVDGLSVAENIFLGREPARFGPLGVVDRRRAESDAAAILERIGHFLDPRRPVGRLSIADKQMVEIAKALSCNAGILIMDEPTAALTEREAETLARLIDQLRASGVTIIFISHILPQVLKVSDRITVLRDGKIVTTLGSKQVKSTGERELAGLMVGRPMAEHFPPRRPAGERTVFEVEGFSVPGAAHNVTFSVRAGEIFGLAGLIGSGRTETAEAITGLRPSSSGAIRLNGRAAAVRAPSDAVRLGIAYLPEDRKDAGLTLNMDVADNITMVSLARYARILLRRTGQERAAAGYVQRMRIRAGALGDPVSTLSGGNQQKVLLAKWLETAPKVLIVDEPTRGVDIGAKEEIYHLLQELAAQGMACIMISSEMNELLGMCHRIGVMRQGRLATILDGAAATEQDIIHAASLDGAENPKVAQA
jgi:ribose transport system ATP-binding protein